MVDLNHYLMKETEIQKIISNSVLKDFFEIRSNVKWRTIQYFLEFDIVLYQNDIIYAIIEIKQNLRQPSAFNIAKEQIKRALTLTECRFGIITDGDTYYLKDTSLANTEFQLKEFNQLVAYLINPDAILSDADKMTSLKKALEMFFVAVKPEYQSLGLPAILINTLAPKIIENGVKYCYSGLYNTYFNCIIKT